MNAAAPKLLNIPIGEIHESPWNPRTHFDKAALQELAESLKTHGQLEPVLVRMRPEGGYELAGGHRRYRAAKLAGLMALEAKARFMTDDEFLEILTISNLQREDVHPLEEAQGYRRLMEEVTGYDTAKIAKRVGKSEQYIYDRLRLLKLTKPAQQLFLDGRIELGHAVLLARLSAEDQARAISPDNAGHLGAARSGLWQPAHEGNLFEEVDDTSPYAGLKAVSVKELRIWIDDNIRFDVAKDETAPMLFPATVALIQQAEAEEEKIVHITYDHAVPNGARDPKVRTIGEPHWKRADGNPDVRREGESAKPTKTCDRSVVGVVVAGIDRGQAFLICAAKDKCEVHWAKEVRERKAKDKQKAKAASGDPKAKAKLEAQEKREATRRAKEAEALKLAEARAARIRKAVPALTTWIAEHVDGLAIGKVVAKIIDSIRNGDDSYYDAAEFLPAKPSAEGIVRAMMAGVLARLLPADSWGRFTTHDANQWKAWTGTEFDRVLDEVDPPANTDAAAVKSGAKKKGTKKP